MSEERFKDALQRIDKMDLGLQVKEIIRRAFHPDEPCSQCRGAGKVPNHWADCGSCTSWETHGPWSGNCKKNIKKNIDESTPRCSDGFKHRLRMLTCPSCDGKKEKVVVTTEQAN